MWNKVDFLFAHRWLEGDELRTIERLDLNEMAVFVVEARCFRAEFIEDGIKEAWRRGNTAVAGKGNVDGFHRVQVICSSTRQYIRDTRCGATSQDNGNPCCLCFMIESQLFRRIVQTAQIQVIDASANGSACGLQPKVVGHGVDGHILPA